MEDEEIIELFRERSEAAIEETRKKYGRLVVNAAMRVLRSERDAEECENDVYMIVWSRIPPERPANFQAFLARIARNQALKRYEFLTAEKRNPVAVQSLDELGDCASEQGEELRYSDIELAELMNGFLATLNEETRRVFLLRYWYFAPVSEICQRCGISKSKAESMLFRTRKKLRQYLDTH